MEQITAFALGMFIVALLVGFVSMFRASKTVKTNKQSIDDLSESLKELRQWTTLMNDDTHRAIDSVENNLHSRVDGLQSLVDSRVDKLHSFVTRELDVLTNTKKSK